MLPLFKVLYACVRCRRDIAVIGPELGWGVKFGPNDPIDEEARGGTDEWGSR